MDDISPIIFLNRTKAALNCAAGSMEVRTHIYIFVPICVVVSQLTKKNIKNEMSKFPVSLVFAFQFEF